ncbi:hypothetical protein [Neobacillus vireti]|uniref:hypothetical protein n=1 Tax=Neobacillus vireti TaxID=220686 RepID=UPI003000550E
MKGLLGSSSFGPFFSFIVIVALGVDYRISLMMRMKEYPGMSTEDAIVLASKQIGYVIMQPLLFLEEHSKHSCLPEYF